MASGRYCHIVRTDALERWIQTNAILNSSKFLDIDGRPDGKFSSFGQMLLTNERPDGIPRCPDECKGTELTDLNSAQSLLEAHN
jgi:hypothetical protein